MMDSCVVLILWIQLFQGQFSSVLDWNSEDILNTNHQLLKLCLFYLLWIDNFLLLWTTMLKRLRYYVNQYYGVTLSIPASVKHKRWQEHYVTHTHAQTHRERTER